MGCFSKDFVIGGETKIYGFSKEYVVMQNASVRVADRCLPRLACLLFSFRLLWFSITEEVNYRNVCLAH